MRGSDHREINDVQNIFVFLSKFSNKEERIQIFQDQILFCPDGRWMEGYIAFWLKTRVGFRIEIEINYKLVNRRVKISCEI